MGEIVPILHERHRGKRWQDRDGDIWYAAPDTDTGWLLDCAYTGITLRAVPSLEYGPYREVVDA